MSSQLTISQQLKETVVSVGLKNRRSPLSEKLIFVSAIITIIVMLLFIYYIFSEALPVFTREGLGFITSSIWNYKTDQYGILYFIAATLWVTATTMAIACPISILTAIFLSEFAPKRLSGIMRPMIELLVGIPSIVYGMFGLILLSSLFRDNIKPLIGSTLGFIPIFANVAPSIPYSILFASSIMAVMVLPTITVITIEALQSVPREYKDASIALGATKWETIKKVAIPVALPGIITAILLGMMRAMGETMAVVMLTGNILHMPSSILDTGYVMTSKILNDILFYFADDNARSALMGIALVLFLIEFILVIAIKAIGARIR